MVKIFFFTLFAFIVQARASYIDCVADIDSPSSFRDVEKSEIVIDGGNRGSKTVYAQRIGPLELIHFVAHSSSNQQERMMFIVAAINESARTTTTQKERVLAFLTGSEGDSQYTHFISSTVYPKNKKYMVPVSPGDLLEMGAVNSILCSIDY